MQGIYRSAFLFFAPVRPPLLPFVLLAFAQHDRATYRPLERLGMRLYGPEKTWLIRCALETFQDLLKPPRTQRTPPTESLDGSFSKALRFSFAICITLSSWISGSLRTHTHSSIMRQVEELSRNVSHLFAGSARICAQPVHQFGGAEEWLIIGN